MSPRFTPAPRPLFGGFDGDASDQRKAWFGVQDALLRRLEPWLDDGWEIVPRTLGPSSLRIAAAPASHWAARLGFDWRSRDRQLFVSSATVWLQRPVHP